MKKSLAIPMKHRAPSQKNMVLTSSHNEIFKLNEDCLVQMFRYLPLKDVVTLLQTDERFRSAALVRFSDGGLTQIDRSFLRDIPRDIREDFYKAYGPRASRMGFESMYWSEFIETIRHFKNLKKLSLIKIYRLFSDEDLEELELPGSLESLKINYCIIEDQILQEWFVKINATLTELQIGIDEEDDRWKPKTYNYLNELTNLNRLRIYGYLPEEPLERLLEQNKNHLHSLVLDRFTSDDRFLNVPMGTNVWRNISTMHQLTDLELNVYEISGIDPELSNLWPELRSLALTVGDPSAIISRLGCEQSLNTLCLSKFIHEYEIDLRILSRFPNLRTVNLESFCWVNSLSHIVVLQQVHFLDLHSGSFDDYHEIVDMVANMPNLRNLKLTEAFFPTVAEDFDNDFDKLEKELRRALETLEPRNPPFEFELSIARE